MNFIGNYEALAGSHHLNHMLTLELLKNPANYEIVDIVGAKEKEYAKAYA
jgi:UDP-3-O-[3-hydroxymyristoyl] N-acetylglucosamine deacetylase